MHRGPDAWTGTCPRITYYDGSSQKVIVPADPNISPQQSGFGSPVHHDAVGGYSNISLTIVFQGAHMAVFDRKSTLDGAVETIRYVFMDGLDYFQYAYTTDATRGTGQADSRTPYCMLKWNVTGNAADGVAFAATHNYWQPAYNYAYTYTGTCDIPYAWEWGDGLEVGFVQSQSYARQPAGNPAWAQSVPPSGSSLADADVPNLDFQMNFYDRRYKITWGMQYGWMGGTAFGMRNKWGQYSLSIIFDARAAGGAMRIRDENSAINANRALLTAVTGTVMAQGPTGSANPVLNTLAPAGFDHIHRCWWAAAAAGRAELRLAIADTARLTNPSFRVSSMDGLPPVVSLSGTALTAGVDYYASLDLPRRELWLTLNRTLTGSTSLGIGVITTATPTPGAKLRRSLVSVDVTAYSLQGRRLGAHSRLPVGAAVVRCQDGSGATIVPPGARSCASAE